MRLALLLLAWTLATPARAQDPPADADANATSAQPQATELAPVRVIGRRPPDPFGFRNPVETDTTVFDRAWDEPPSVEEIGMRGGIVQIGINKGLELAAKGIRKLPGWQNQVIGARARPPPLDEAQLERAMRLQGQGAQPSTSGEAPR